MEKKVNSKGTEDVIEKIKAWAFPALMAVVVFFGQDLVRTTKEIQANQVEQSKELVRLQEASRTNTRDINDLRSQIKELTKP